LNQVYIISLSFQIFIHFIFTEDSQGNINPYAVTGYSIHYKNETDHGPFCKENRYNQCDMDTTGEI
jgi:hypothetical protein